MRLRSRLRHRRSAIPDRPREPYWTPEAFYAARPWLTRPAPSAPPFDRAEPAAAAGVVQRVLRVALPLARLRPSLQHEPARTRLASVHDLEARRRKLARIEHRPTLYLAGAQPVDHVHDGATAPESTATLTPDPKTQPPLRLVRTRERGPSNGLPMT